MASLDNPERYDLDPDGNCDGECGRCRATMERRGNGDWVRYDDYAALLADRDALQARLDEITGIAAEYIETGKSTVSEGMVILTKAEHATMATQIEQLTAENVEANGRLDMQMKKLALLAKLLAQRDAEAQETLTEVVEVERERNHLRRLARALFEDYLDVVEESDSGREFRPISINCCRAGEVEPLTQLLRDMRVAAGLPADPPKLEREGRP